MSQFRSKIESGVVVCGAWLLVGFLGAAEAAGEFAQLFAGKPLQLTAIALLFSGIALAIASWRCARMALEPAWQVPQRDTNAAGDLSGRPLSPQAEGAHALRHRSYSTAIAPQTP